ncbi:LarC family nickel insertion protein [Tengunoibacter tsumagoiensis]|uniref:LarC family nickel insertion protein n=1 Tax=Tengunoibacter tsumagoiensis TaxID=2014871 RepID=A0A401ZUR0_9CHLR|nr:LarC family nickel insertion protein [Tengunoibacter tsumagoiensis]GCE10526.1 hypothetical protein KTT_03850 [Tengunoibacter tsumagoiensis]
MTTRIAYLDCHSGISGDMFLGAMLDAGLPFELLQQRLLSLPIEGYTLKVRPYSDQGITGSQLMVELAQQEQPVRGLQEILHLLEQSDLSPTVCKQASAIFRTLGKAEAAIHGVPLEEIHFHEVGALDSIVDIVGAAIAIDALEITKLYASPLPLTRGHLRMAHGLMPIPAPATLKILSQVKAPWTPTSLEGELVTPTGAAILATLATFEMPAIAIEQVGYGFGQKRLIWPNCLRVYLGSSFGMSHDYHNHAHTHSHHDHSHDHD